jgi:hypothetical protein
MSRAANFMKKIRNLESSKIVPIPILHGSDLLPGLQDELKLELLDIFLEEVSKYSEQIIRHGYYDDGLDFLQRRSDLEFSSDEDCKLHFVFQTLWMGYTPPQDQSYQFVHEVSVRSLDKSPSFSNLDQGTGYSKLEQIDPDNVTVPIGQFIGHFYAPKTDVCCQAADIAGYLAHRAERENSGQFGQELEKRFSTIENKFTHNRIANVNSVGEI